MALAVIVGSAFASPPGADPGAGPALFGLPLVPFTVATPYGSVELHALDGQRHALVLFRHGLPHRWLPHQIPYRAQAAALQAAGVQSLLVTSAVGVLRPALPLFTPLLVRDLLMPDNRLPDGSACTMFSVPGAGQGHLVIDGGLLNVALTNQCTALAEGLGLDAPARVVFAYSPGPRTKTAAENAFWAAAGADVASMTVGPELVLANELQIPCAALVVGHKASHVGASAPLDPPALAASLQRARQNIERLVLGFLVDGQPVDWTNRWYQF